MQIQTTVLCSITLIAGFSAASSGATLAVSPDKLTYNVGETITLTVTGDDGGASAHGIFGRLEYNTAGLVKNATRTQATLVGNSGNWIKGGLPFSDGPSANSTAFNQIEPSITTGPDTILNLPGTLSTITLIASATGVVNVNWNTAAGSGFEILFFGLTNAPGTSFTIVGTPEPTTGALLALGLLGLAGWRRVRPS